MEDGEPKIDVQITPKSDRKLNLKIPSELYELQEVDVGNEKPEPVMKGAVMDEWYTPDELCIDESFEKDLQSCPKVLGTSQLSCVFTIDLK